jgi:hypothetical protein
MRVRYVFAAIVLLLELPILISFAVVAAVLWVAVTIGDAVQRVFRRNS